MNPRPKALQRDFLRAQTVIVEVFLPVSLQPASRHADWSGQSHDAWAGQLFPASRTPHQRRLPRSVASPVQTAALIRQRQQLVCCCLIYKLPIFRMLGASARWSRLHTPVETGTPPCRRSKRCSRGICLRPWAFQKCSGSLLLPLLSTSPPLCWAPMLVKTLGFTCKLRFSASNLRRCRLRCWQVQGR